jgi:peroxiredoxin (alkyl hydroperoxide reductase subunit C)
VTVGRLAPDFRALSTHGYINLSDYRGRWVVLFSHPAAFTPVSTSEMIMGSYYYPEYLKRNVQIIALTTDNNFANLAWVYDIFAKTGISIPFPVIADNDKVISNLYGMANADRTYEESVRDAFLINPAGKIMAIVTMPYTSGRNAVELLRIIDAIQITENYNYFTPAAWQPGNPVLVPPVYTYEELINRVNSAAELGYDCPFWYLCYKNINTETEPETINYENPNLNVQSHNYEE